MLQKVHHPHCVQFLGACTHAQPYMIVTEFLPGGSLSDLFRRASPLHTLRMLLVQRAARHVEQQWLLSRGLLDLSQVPHIKLHPSLCFERPSSQARSAQQAETPSWRPLVQTGQGAGPMRIVTQRGLPEQAGARQAGHDSAQVA